MTPAITVKTPTTTGTMITTLEPSDSFDGKLDSSTALMGRGEIDIFCGSLGGVSVLKRACIEGSFERLTCRKQQIIEPLSEMLKVIYSIIEQDDQYSTARVAQSVPICVSKFLLPG